jgi:hypothetical protein
MIIRNEYTVEAFLYAICSHLEPGCRSNEFRGDYYFGSGYWRGIPVIDDHCKMVGIRLVNPDLSQDDINTVEKALGIICHYEVK